MVAVTVLPDGIRVEARPGESIVDALRRSGWRSRYKCRRGGCGSCKSRFTSGRIVYDHAVAASVLSDAEQAAGICLPCRAVPVTDVVIEQPDRPMRPALSSERRSHPHEPTN
jgi:ferredoxin